MNAFFKKLFADRIIMYDFYATVSLVALSFVIVLFAYAHLSPFIPLYNQMPWGEARLGTKNQIFFPIALAFLIFTVNLFISSKLYEKTPLLARMLSVVSLLTSFLLFVFIIRTVIVVL